MSLSAPQALTSECPCISLLSAPLFLYTIQRKLIRLHQLHGRAISNLWAWWRHSYRGLDARARGVSFHVSVQDAELLYVFGA